MASAAPLKPWQRRQGSSTLTEQLPPRLSTECAPNAQCKTGELCYKGSCIGAVGSGMSPGVTTLTSSPVSASLSGVSPAMSSTAPVLTSASTLASSSNALLPASSSSSTTAAQATASTAAQAASASASASRAQAAGVAGTTTGAMSTTGGYGTSTLGGGYGSTYGSSYGGGYGSRMGMGMGGGYGAYGGMGMGMGMNRYGSQQQNRGDFFGPDTDSMGRFNEILDFNGFLLDRISDCSSNIYQRLKHILLWLFELKHQIQRSHNASISDEERQELRKKILKRMIVLGSLATIFFLWCIRSLYRRRKQKRLADWNRIFPSQSAL